MGIVGEQTMPSYDEKRRKLVEVIQKNAIVFQDVQLFSKIKSQYYYDIKRISLQKEGAHLLAELLLSEIYKYGPKSVGGMEMGAVALVTAVVFKSTMDGKYEKGLNGFFIRKEAKGYGLQKRIEGNMIPPVVIVDDVITSGKSVMDSIEAVNAEGITPKGVVCVIDREEADTPNVLKQSNIKYSSLFKHSEFKPFIEQKLEEKRRAAN
ncbi:MAG: orotate phosphoribosyltransferase [Nitrososphaeraceae archaeon]|nr:orotate phosphoribosyltransferase [Nitrososphaeraceae archaeon]MBV9668574.1 orotate phosphoribosyltransferase [Nitrososphaeraceae archaeon]